MSTNNEPGARPDPNGLRRIYGDAGCRWQGTDEYHAHEGCHEDGLRAVAAAAWDEGCKAGYEDESMESTTNPYLPSENALVVDDRTKKT